MPVGSCPDPAAGDNREWLNGFDQRCYLPPLMPQLPPQPRPNVYDRATWLRFIDLIILSYSDMTQCAAALQDYFGGTATIATVDNTAALTPGSAIACNADYGIVVIPGTSNFFQIALQLFDPAVGLTDFGGFSTAAIWGAAMGQIASRIDAVLLDPTCPVFLCGHSYGGAVALLLAAVMKRAQTDREIQCLTFGAPRPGDDRVRELLEPVKCVQLANTADFVTGVPPVAGELTGLEWFIPSFYFDRWTAARATGRQIVVDDLGVAQDDQDTQLTFAKVYDLILKILASTPLSVPFSHFAAEYKRRLLL